MFIILGGDGREYGPASVSQVRSWLAGGRANLDTKAKAIGSEEWRRLSDYAEFAPPGSLPPAIPPPLPQAIPRAATAAIETSELAHRGARTGAALLNAFFYFVCMFPGCSIMSQRLLAQNPEIAEGKFPKLDEIDLAGLSSAVTWVWVGLLAAIALQSMLIAVRGQNLGKLAFGGRVVRSSDGGPAGFVRGAVLRFILPVTIVIFLNVIFPLGFVFLLVDYCFIFRDDQRCLHDLIAGTKVVRT